MAIILKPGEYQWRETPGGTGWCLLRHDPERDTQTRLLRYAPMTLVPAATLDHGVEWLVIRGAARCGDLELRRGGYYFWPSGAERPAVCPGPEGYAVLSVVYGAASPVRKSLLAVPDVESLPWETDVATADGPQLEVRRLGCDVETGALAELWRLQPGAPLPLGPAAALQELFVLHGSLGWEGERLPLTSYMAFAPGDDRGVLKAEAQPAILFVNTHAG
jgi:hypothetical protein